MKTALITGASTGIGKSIALKMGDSGFKVLLIARSIEKLTKLKNEIEFKGGQAEVCVTDLSDINSINKLITEIKSKYSKIDLICNVAGIWHSDSKVFAGTEFSKFDQKTILDTYTVGLTAPTLIVHGLVDLMPKGANIINISGTFENGAKGWLPYYSSKKALEDFTFGLADELKGNEIKVNCISPSDTVTEEYKKWFPEYIDEAILPHQIADYVLKLVSDKALESGTSRVLKKFNYSKEDIGFVKLAIKTAEESLEAGAFPAGAVLVKDNKIIAKSISAKYPEIIYHAESSTIDKAMTELHSQLTDCTLYTSMEPCLMCLSRGYWAGIRKIVFALKKESTLRNHYESNHSTNEILERFNEKIELIQIEELENEALFLVREWEKVN